MKTRRKTMDKLSMMSRDNAQANIEKIKALFPNAVTEVIRDGKPTLAVDFDVLKQEMSSILVDDKEERYQFTWPDKKKSILLANSPISATLRPCKEESVDFDNTENLYIEGDNLDVLKLLQETYLGKIKMIYIDPPYNTGNDFVYNDDFAESSEEYLANSGQYDEQGNRLVHNTESNGRFHTDWLNMIYPRLKIAKDLLSDDGVIFISIDDNEVHNLKKMCDEIFCERNFLTCVTRSTGTPTGGGFDGLVNELDYMLIYAKNIERTIINGLPMGEEDSKIYDQEDEYGRYLIRPLRRTGGEDRREDRPTMYFPIIAPDGTPVYPIGPTGYESRWICSPDTAKKLAEEHLLAWKKTEKDGIVKWTVYQKFYLENRTKAPGNLWNDIEGNKKATRDIRTIFDSQKVFDFPKPVGFIEKVLRIGSNKDSIILDFFSGSATTAHAVMQLNAEDGGNRKFIMVQLPEETEAKSEAYKAGYKTICEIGKERIRRAGKKILEQNELSKETRIIDTKEQLSVLDALKGNESAIFDFMKTQPTTDLSHKNLDVGFRVLKLDSSNMKDVFYRPSELTIDLLAGLESNIKEDRTPFDLLFQVMLELGKPLSAKIEEKVVAGKNVYVVDENDLIACFDENITEEVVKTIAQMKPLYAVFRDNSFANDTVATNFDQIFATYSPDTTRKVL